ncbi:hypothetical protein ABZ342_47385 [Amycolatopsis sp. NPDC005961]|uniref:hypothetical protein n=1 Tax=Amycolatopsis sp. NPDC005961 TaxID=3156720 RepID=UPI0033F60E9C
MTTRIGLRFGISMSCGPRYTTGTGVRVRQRLRVRIPAAVRPGQLGQFVVSNHILDGDGYWVYPYA